MFKCGSTLPALALAGVLAVAFVPAAWAQTATKLDCKKCVKKKQIAKEAIKEKINEFKDAYNEVVKFINAQSTHSEEEGAGVDVLGWDVVRYVYNRGGGVDGEDGSLELADVGVAEPEIGQERDDRGGHRSLYVGEAGAENSQANEDDDEANGEAEEEQINAAPHAEGALRLAEGAGTLTAHLHEDDGDEQDGHQNQRDAQERSHWSAYFLS